jgi:hypothetical protein
VSAKFFFFTDPSLLDPQTAAQAFGPAGTADGKDQFRVTDLHTSSAADIPAVAICDGILCAQEDTQGTLTLILKPSETPPFESAVVSSFIRRSDIETLTLVPSPESDDTDVNSPQSLSGNLFLESERVAGSVICALIQMPARCLRQYCRE